MKTTLSLFVFDHVKKSIVGTKNSLKKAGRPNTPESDLLASMMKQHPNYSVVEKAVKVNSSKNIYDGLTLPFMQAYLEIQDNAEEMLAFFNRVVDMATKQKKKYPLTKSWFTGMYPNLDVKKAQEEIDAYWIAKAVEVPNAATAQ